MTVKKSLAGSVVKDRGPTLRNEKRKHFERKREREGEREGERERERERERAAEMKSPLLRSFFIPVSHARQMNYIIGPVPNLA